MSRADALSDFIARAIGQAENARPLAGDASARRYTRLYAPSLKRSLVLLDADPATNAPVDRFCQIARHLTGIGLSPPEIIAEDRTLGAVLLEDLGDDLFARVVSVDPALERPLYRAACDVLLVLRDAPLPTAATDYGPQTMCDQAALAFDCYAPEVSDAGRAETLAALRSALDQTVGPERCLALRDYHAENLLWLPERAGPARVGLLDFQDAVAAHPTYDLASLLRDARRDVSPETTADAKAYYLERAGMDRAGFDAAFAGNAIVRNLRILGIFARLARRDGKPGYAALMPRVWAQLMQDLAHPAFAEVARLASALVPEPTPSYVQ